MHGPIDYIVVGFVGNNFNDSILRELEAAQKSGVIAVLDAAVISKDNDGNMVTIELTDLDHDVIQALLPGGTSPGLITDEDVEEVADVLDNNCSAGLLIVEQLWAKPLKKAILEANGVLMAEGRIHPDALEEVNERLGE